MRTVIVVLVAIIAAATLPSAIAQQVNDAPRQLEQPFVMTAEKVTYDEQLNLVTASGNVEIVQGERILRADTVSYNATDGVVTASGNISLLEPAGDVIFADYLQLDQALTTGIVRGIRILLEDDSRFAANSARRFADERTELTKAVYSPCRLCPEHAQRSPLWQLKAVKIVHDRRQKTIEYKDAVLEVYGVPVAYTPFFRHPDPTVKRKSGFLAPTFGSSSDLGFRVQVPYYWAIAPNRDLTIAPIVTSKERAVLTGEYRELTDRGGYQLAASGTYVEKRGDDNERLDKDEFRGHLKGRGKFDLNDTWRWGFDAYRATDDTYLRRYDIASDDTLQSDLYIEGFRGRNYASASSYAFQGLRLDDDPGETPFVAPLLAYHHVGQPEGMGGRGELDLSMASLYRTGGTDSRRFSARGRWELPYTSSIGEIYTVTAGFYGDLYWLNDHAEANKPRQQPNSGLEGRAIPMAALEWRFPVVRNQGTIRQIIEPIVQAVVMPFGGNPGSIPNEDSISFEFDDTNLFSLNRLPGHDRVETGPRLNYGLKAGAYGAGGGSTTMVVGQVLRLKADDTFSASSGLADNRSDYVARVTITPASWLDVTNRVRLDRQSFNLRRNELYFSIGPKNIRLSGSYVKLAGDINAEQADTREELFVAGRASIDENWSITARSRRDITDGGRQIRLAFGTEYQDECITFRVTFDRDFTRDRDVEPSTSVNFRVILRHLG